MLEEKQRQRERAIAEEGRALWQNKRREELEREIRDVEEVSLTLWNRITCRKTEINRFYEKYR